MPRGLVQHDAPRGPLLDQEKTACLLGDGCDSEVDLQGHEPIIAVAPQELGGIGS